MADETLAKLQAPLADLPCPDIVLGVKPKIKTIDDAELALREIAWCEAAKTTIKARAAELLNEINELATRAACYAVGEEQVPVGDRQAVLEAALFKWAESNRADLCPGKKKSVALRNGNIKWRDGKDSVDYLEGCSQKTAVETIGNESGLLARLEAMIDEIEWHGVFQAKLTVNKTNAVKARQKQQLTDEQLADVGLEFKPGEEYITVEPAEFVRAGV